MPLLPLHAVTCRYRSAIAAEEAKEARLLAMASAPHNGADQRNGHATAMANPAHASSLHSARAAAAELRSKRSHAAVAWGVLVGGVCVAAAGTASAFV